MKVIMTASRSELTAMQNANRNVEMLDTVDAQLKLSGIPVRGVWKGTEEASYMFTGVNMAGVMRLHLLANIYKQDAILVIGDDNRCFLIESNGLRVDVGDWHKVDRAIAIQFDGYSVIGGDYYISATHADLVNARRRLLATQASVIAANEYAARVNAAGI